MTPARSSRSNLLGHGTADAPHDPAVANFSRRNLKPRARRREIDDQRFSLGCANPPAPSPPAREALRPHSMIGIGENMFRTTTPPRLSSYSITRARRPKNSRHDVCADRPQAPGNDPRAIAACLRVVPNPSRVRTRAGHVPDVVTSPPVMRTSKANRDVEEADTRRTAVVLRGGSTISGAGAPFDGSTQRSN